MKEFAIGRRFAARPWVFAILVGVLLLPVAKAAPGGQPAVKHPNLLLNREEIEQIKDKIRTQKWAADLFERVKAMADDMVAEGARHERETALCYTLTGDPRYGEAAHRFLLEQARYFHASLKEVDLKVNPEWSAWSPRSVYAWAYDLAYDTFSAEERERVESWLREECRIVIQGEKAWTTTPNLVFEKHYSVALVGYCLGDRELIEWGLNDPGAHGPQRGGFYQVMDTMIEDRHFWAEAPIYTLHYDIHGMLALAEAARRYDGTDLYRYVSPKSGASLKSIIDGYVLLGYPLERTGIGRGSIRMVTFADGSTNYGPRGDLYETFLVNPVGTERNPSFSGELEIAYKRFKDPGYAWLLSLNPKRDANIGYGRAVWGYVGLTYGEVLPENPAPPPAPGGVYPGLGFALLRADESPSYWTAGGLTALVMLGKWLGHGHSDDYNLILHGKGRLLYPDLNVIQYEPSYLNWTREGIAHNTLLVDHQSPSHGPFTTRNDLNEDVKHFAITGSAYPTVKQTRALLLTKQYVADFFQAADIDAPMRSHVFDSVLHGLGRLYPGNPGAYRPTHDLVPYYWWVDNERGRATDATFQADWIQRTAGVTPGLQAFGNEWFQHEVGVRLTMLGSKGTRVYAGDGPFTNGPPYHRIEGNPEGSLPLVVVRREAPAAVFAAVHEPYEGRPHLRQVRRLKETATAVAIMVQAPEFTDYLMVAFDDNEHTLTPATGEIFTFAEYGYLRVQESGIRAAGKLAGFRVGAPPLAAGAQATVNGKQERLDQAGRFLQWGKIAASQQTPTLPADETEDSLERAASVHCCFQPEEAHLAAGDEREVEMHLRCVGAGQTGGQFRLVAPKGLQAEPALIAVEPMAEGQERMVRFKVRAAQDAAGALREVRLVPENGLRAAPQALVVSTGVVMTTDARVPKSAQFVVRAPGYMMNVDHYSAVGHRLLDADGRRRYGCVVTGNFLTGFAGLACAEKWSFLFGLPCEGIWVGPNNLTARSLALGGAPTARLLYTFAEDRIVIKVVPPSDPTREFTMWLGNFDVLGRPIHNGKQEQPWSPIVADRFFFPHPLYRQGVLLTTPPQTALQLRGNTAVSFPIRAGQEVTLRFAEQSEMLARP